MPHCRKSVDTLVAGIIQQYSTHAPRLPVWKRWMKAWRAYSGNCVARSNASCGKVGEHYPQMVRNPKLWKKSFPQCKNFPQEKRGRYGVLARFPTYTPRLLLVLLYAITNRSQRLWS